VPLLIDDGEGETSALDRALKDKNGIEAQRKFLAEPQIRFRLIIWRVLHSSVPIIFLWSIGTDGGYFK
jgi:hypothetical protein